MLIQVITDLCHLQNTGSVLLVYIFLSTMQGLHITVTYKIQVQCYWYIYYARLMSLLPTKYRFSVTGIYTMQGLHITDTYKIQVQCYWYVYYERLTYHCHLQNTGSVLLVCLLCKALHITVTYKIQVQCSWYI